MTDEAEGECVVVVTDEMIDAARDIIEKADGMEAEALALGVFMAMLCVMEGDDLLFGETVNGPFYRGHFTHKQTH